MPTTCHDFAVRIRPGLPIGDGPAVAHTGVVSTGFEIVMGRSVTESKVVKVLAHELLHVFLHLDPVDGWKASEALDDIDPLGKGLVGT
jgi:hypothetical protein